MECTYDHITHSAQAGKVNNEKSQINTVRIISQSGMSSESINFIKAVDKGNITIAVNTILVEISITTSAIHCKNHPQGEAK